MGGTMRPNYVRAPGMTVDGAARQRKRESGLTAILRGVLALRGTPIGRLPPPPLLLNFSNPPVTKTMRSPLTPTGLFIADKTAEPSPNSWTLMAPL
jgi:hypothetical protein